MSVARRSLSKLAGALCVVMAGLVFGSTSASATVGPPVVKRVWASEVHRSTAYINAVVNPSEAETTYRFEYGSDTSYGSSIPVPDGELGAGAEGIEVSQLLTGLQPGGTYHYRIVATNSAGTTVGKDMTFTMFSAPTSEPADTCSNANYRVGFSAGLPDCRAYEMVSPVEKNGGDVSGDQFGQVLASELGDLPGEIDRAVFMSKTGFGQIHGSGNVGYYQYMAERGPDRWVSKGITPTPNAGIGGQVLFGKTELKEFSADLNVAALQAYTLPEGPTAARPNSSNLYLENTSVGTPFAAITDASHEGEPLPIPPFLQLFAFRFETPELGGGSSSLDVVTFMSRVNFTPEAHGFEYKAYVYEHGEVKLLGILPKGEIPPGGSILALSEQSGNEWNEWAIEEKDTVSTDGSRVLFEVPEFPHQLFMRKNGSTSVLVSESETSQPVTAENVELQAASPDLKHIVFSTSSRLLDSAPEGGGLYMYTDSTKPETESNLTYIGGSSELSVGRVSNGSVVLGMNKDGTRIYYKTFGGVKLWNSGQTLQIVPRPSMTVQSNFSEVHGRATESGGTLAFFNTETLNVNGHTSYNNEMYVYNESTNALTCVSCPSTNAAPTVGIELGVKATETSPYIGEPYKPRFMSNDGRYVFFNTTEALLPQDTNGVTDAYEYDNSTGRLSLLSTGTGEDAAWFVDASADGHDAFLVTSQQLNRWDPDKLVDLYDARVEGGLPEPPVPPAQCAGDACQGTPSSAPTFNTASGFTGLGNPSFVNAVTVSRKAKPNQRLWHALAVCRRKPKHKQARCERLARRRYGAKSSAHNRRAGR